MADTPHSQPTTSLLGWCSRELTWLLGLIIQLYITLVLVTYHPHDPAWSQSGAENTEGQVHNAGGALGALISDIGFSLFGYSLMWWVVAGWVLLIGHYYFRRRGEVVPRNTRYRWVGGFILLLLGSCGLEALYQFRFSDLPPQGAGGMIGTIIRIWGEKLIGTYGITLLLLFSCATGWSMITRLSWLHVMERLGLLCERWTTQFITWQRALAAQRKMASHEGISLVKSPLSTESNHHDAFLSRLPRFFSGGESHHSSSDSPAENASEHTEQTIATANPSWQDRVEDAVALEPFKDRLSSFWSGWKKPGVQKAAPELSLPTFRLEPTLGTLPLSSVTPASLEAGSLPASQTFHYAQSTETLATSLQDMADPHISPALFKSALSSTASSSQDMTHKSGEEDTHTPSRVAPTHYALPDLPELAELDEAPATAAYQPTTRKTVSPTQNQTIADTPSLPPLRLLDPSPPPMPGESPEKLEGMAQLIESKLREFGVSVNVVAWHPGPVITRFEIEPASGVKGSQIVNLVKDLARALSVVSIRVVETIPGRNTMGLEIPNSQRQIVRLVSILNAPVYKNAESRLTLAMGQDIAGNPQVADLAKMPHALVAGTTGSGKSVAINAMILSLLFKATPEEVRLIMIDPKMLELSVYESIPHLLAPVVTDMKLAAHALNWCVGEMDRRYRLMSLLGVRNLAGYNQKIRDAKKAGKPITNPATITPDSPEPLEPMPMIVVIIDELADLMMVAGKKIEELIARLAQKARASGIHLILATQRPSVDVITGLIKANVPTRVAFQVSSKIDSRTILDQMGAEALLGQGDMLYLPPGTGFTHRLHGAFVADHEVHRVVEFWKSQGAPNYVEGILEPEESATSLESGSLEGSEEDPLYDEAVGIVIKSRRASISLVQRQLRIGYNRAARLIEQMEASGLVSSMQANGNREVLAPPHSGDH